MIERVKRKRVSRSGRTKEARSQTDLAQGNEDHLCQLELQQTQAEKQLQLERIQAEHAIRESRNFAEAIVETIREPLLVLDHNLTMVSVNKAFGKIFRTVPDQALGKPLASLLDPHCDGQGLFELLRNVLAQDTTIENYLVECELRFLGKRFMLLNARRLNRDSNKLPFVLIALEDVTEQKRIEETFRRNQQNLEDFFENAPVGLHWATAEGRLLWVNEHELGMLGYAREEYLGHSILEFHEDQAAVKELLRQLLKGESINHFESRVRCKDGSIKDVAICANALWEQGRFIHTRCFTLEITQRKEAEEALRNLNAELERRVVTRTAALQQTTREMEAFCYTIAHDLRAPLRAMEGFARALLDDYAGHLDDAGKGFAQRIADAAQREDRLIQDLLEYSQLKLTPLDLAVVSLETIVRSALESLRDTIQAKTAHVRLSSPLPDVMGNLVTLEQVLVHLLSNALKFVEAGVAPKIRLWAEKRESRVRVWIEDNGIGISQEYHDRIFSVFERLHGPDSYPGTGIGLALVRKGVERMGGSVGVESTLRKGSRFWFELPAGPTTLEPARKPSR